MYADIIVDISQEQLDKTFQYRIPPELENEVRIGVMVQIPFGRVCHRYRQYPQDSG